MAVPQCSHTPDWNAQPFVSVLVLNWNGRKYLGPCLESLRADRCPHVEAIVVDNGSTDGSAALVRDQFPDVRLVAHPENLGFSRGYNAAVPHARGKVLVFLNNDTEVEKGWLGALIAPLLGAETVGITTSKLVFYRTGVLNGAGGYMKLWTGGGELGLGQRADRFLDGQTVEPFYASGAAMAMRTELFERLGGFDERLFAYCEDSDLSWRARLLGYRVRYVPSSVVHHHFSATHKLFNPRKVGMVTRHHIRGMVKNLSTVHLVHSLPAYMAFAVSKGLALSVLMRDAGYAAAVFSAFSDLVLRPAELMHARRQVQRQRLASDRVALRSSGFGLLETPWHFWRVARAASDPQRAGSRE